MLQCVECCFVSKFTDKTSCPLVTGFEEVIVRCSLVPSNLFGMERLHSYTAIDHILTNSCITDHYVCRDCVSSGWSEHELLTISKITNNTCYEDSRMLLAASVNGIIPVTMLFLGINHMHNNIVNRNYYKILESDWFCARLFCRVIGARSSGCPIWTTPKLCHVYFHAT